jgi:hypothetical protein
MNDAWNLYPCSYFQIDVIHLIASRMQKQFYRRQLEVLAFADVMVAAIAYDMYLECAEGKLNPYWKLEKHVDY